MRELQRTSSDPADCSCNSCVGSALVEGCREAVGSLCVGPGACVAVRTPGIGDGRLNVILSPCALGDTADFAMLE